MAYTGSPATVRNDRLRLLCGDVSTTAPVLADAEVTWAGTLTDSDYLAAAHCADLLGAHYASQVNTANGALSVGAGERLAHFHNLAASLRRKAAGGMTFFAGGTTVSGKDTLDSDTDATQPAFRVGQDSNPGNAPTSDDEDD